MKRIIITIIVMAVLSLSSCHKNAETADYQVVPLPKEIKTTEEKPFILDKNTIITYPKSHDEIHKEAAFIADYFEDILGYRLQTSCIDETVTNAIILSLNTNELGN